MKVKGVEIEILARNTKEALILVTGVFVIASSFLIVTGSTIESIISLWKIIYISFVFIVITIPFIVDNGIDGETKQYLYNLITGKTRTKVGLSLSACISDIISGKVKESEVKKIIAGTSIGDGDNLGWELLFAEYKRTVWASNPWKAKRILLHLVKWGRIEQPRLDGKEAPDISGGSHWI